MSGDKCRWFNKNGFALGTGECVLHRRVCGSGHKVCEQYEEYEFRPHGEWGEVFEYLGVKYHKCMNCYTGIKVDIDHQNFCPNCGADMRKRGEEK